MENEQSVINMILPCHCPHCGEDIVIKLDMQSPTADVMKPEDVPSDIKNIIENEHDITGEIKTQ